MARKVYLYDSTGFDFFVCDYEGMDANGDPQLTLMTPGLPVANLKEYFELDNAELRDYSLLCEEGKQADSMLMIDMFGKLLINSSLPFGRMAERLEEVRKYDIRYDHMYQRLLCEIYPVFDEATQQKKYRLCMNVGERHRLIDISKDYDSMKEIIMQLANFFIFIEEDVDIPLRKILAVDEKMKSQAKRLAGHIFDEIDTI